MYQAVAWWGLLSKTQLIIILFQVSKVEEIKDSSRITAIIGGPTSQKKLSQAGYDRFFYNKLVQQVTLRHVLPQLEKMFPNFR